MESLRGQVYILEMILSTIHQAQSHGFSSTVESTIMPHPILPIRTTPSPSSEPPSKVEFNTPDAKINGHQRSPSAVLDQEHLGSHHGTMKAVMWEGRVGHVSVHDVPKPRIQKDSELLIRMTTAASELHFVFFLCFNMLDC